MERFFKISLFIKGIDGLLELVGGVWLFFVDTPQLMQWALMLTAHRLSRNPHSWVALSLIHAVDNISLDSKLFVSIYLLTHGLLKIFLVVSLLRAKMWAYPVALFVFGIFIVYQLHRFAHTHSTGLLVFMAFDIIVCGLVAREYRRRLSRDEFFK